MDKLNEEINLINYQAERNKKGTHKASQSTWSEGTQGTFRGQWICYMTEESSTETSKVGQSVSGVLGLSWDRKCVS